MQWPGTATAGYRSHEGRDCDCCRHTALTAAFSKIWRELSCIRRHSQQTRTAQLDHTSGDCRAWPLCVTCPIGELHYVKIMDTFQDWTQRGYCCSHQSHDTSSSVIDCHAARACQLHYTVTFISTHQRHHVSIGPVGERRPLGISYVILPCTTDSLQTAAELSIGLGQLMVSDRAIILTHYSTSFCIHNNTE